MSNDRTIIKNFLLPKENEMDLEYYSLSNDLQIKYKSYYLELKNSYSFKKNISDNNLGYLNYIKQRINNWFALNIKNVSQKFEDSRENFEKLSFNKKQDYINNNLKYFHPINNFLMHTLIFYINKQTGNIVSFKEINLKQLFESYSKRRPEVKKRYDIYVDAYKIILERVKNNLKCQNNFVVDKKTVKFNLDESKKKDKKKDSYNNNKNIEEKIDLNKSNIIQENNKILPKEFEGMKDYYIKEFIYQKNEFNYFLNFFRFYKLFQEYEKFEFNKKLTYNQLCKNENEISVKQNSNIIENEIKFNFKKIKFI